MKKILNLIINRLKQRKNYLFFTSVNLDKHITYKHLMYYMRNLHILCDDKLPNIPISIVLASNSILLKMITFCYCFLAHVDLTLISMKLPIDAIANSILFAREANILIIDKRLESKLKEYEDEKKVSILENFKVVKADSILLIDISSFSITSEPSLNRLLNKGINNVIRKCNQPGKVSILSPGTSKEPSIINVLYETFIKSIHVMSYFMGLKAGDRVAVIAPFEFFPSIFTLLGLLNGVHYLQPEEDIQSAEDYIDQFSSSVMKPEIVIISSYHFKLIWDSILLKVYGNKLMFRLSKTKLFNWVVKNAILREISNTFGKTVKKVHILNEELGTWCLDILRHSKIMFTSSYGFLEQGNFLAFKNPELFRHKDYFNKPGGTVLKEAPEYFERVGINKEDWILTQKDSNQVVGELIVNTMSDLDPRTFGKRLAKSGDWVVEIKNIESQGDRKYIRILGRKSRNEINVKMSIDMAEKTMKDTILIRDCLLVKRGDTHHLYVEPRKDVMNIHGIHSTELDGLILFLIKEVNKHAFINITGYALLPFDRMRNAAGKLEYYTWK